MTKMKDMLRSLAFITAAFSCQNQNTMTTNHVKQPNALIHETSPYLLQHAYNPVNWEPWGKEALEKAKQADKRT